MKITVKNDRETAETAAKLAGKLRTGDVVFLLGTLGAGKTAFARALIRTACGDENMNVPSPTFTLVQQYDATDGRQIHHYDLYRLPEHDAENEIVELGFDESLNSAVTLIEWPERLGYLTPKNRIEITLKHIQNTENGREITVTVPEILNGRDWKII